MCILRRRKEDDDRPLCICLSPDGSTAAVGCDTGKLWFLSTKDGIWAEVLVYPTHVPQNSLREAVEPTQTIAKHEWSSVQLGCCEGSVSKVVFRFPLPCPSHDSNSTLHWERWWTLQSSVGTRTMTFLHVFWQSVEAKQCVKSTKPTVNGSFVVSGWTKIVSQLGARTGGVTKSGIHDVLSYTSWSWVLFFVANQITVHKLKWLSDFAPEIRILNFLPEIFKRIEKSPREDSLGKIGQDNWCTINFWDLSVTQFFMLIARVPDSPLRWVWGWQRVLLVFDWSVHCLRTALRFWCSMLCLDPGWTESSLWRSILFVGPFHPTRSVCFC